MYSRFAACLVVVFAIATSSHAVKIIQPIGVWTDGAPVAGAIGNAIDQSGLLPTYNSGVDDFPTAISTSLNYWRDAVNHLGTNSGATDDFYFDLGAVYEVDAIAIWQQDGSATLRDGRILASADASFTSPVELATFTDLPKHPIFPGFQQAEVISFAPTVARYCAIDVTGNYGYGGYTALNEVAFSGVLVPEPGAVLLVLTGAAAVLSRGRRLSFSHR